MLFLESVLCGGVWYVACDERKNDLFKCLMAMGESSEMGL